VYGADKQSKPISAELLGVADNNGQERSYWSCQQVSRKN